MSLLPRTGRCGPVLRSGTALRWLLNPLSTWRPRRHLCAQRIRSAGTLSADNQEARSKYERLIREEDSSPPSRDQLRAHFIASMVPMVAFGFMDNTVMIHAGNAIDLTLGVTFGMSTMSAAACGQICSDVAGVSFGGVVSGMAARLGLPSSEFTKAQRRSPVARRTGMAGNIVGVFCGCSLGLLNLLVIDPTRKEAIISAAESDGGEDFTVSVSNEEKDWATSIVIEGPATKNLIAAVTQALVVLDCSLVEIHAEYVPYGENKVRKLFVTREGGQIADHDLETLAGTVLNSTRHPERIQRLHIANETLRQQNADLRSRLENLQKKYDDKCIFIRRRSVVADLPPELPPPPPLVDDAE